ncbi:MAG: MerR family transcriptional regulator [Vagococcus sp.]
MSKKELKRTMSVFPIGSVMTLTELSARQIRYYEEQGLIFPKRNQGNNRLFSLNDIDCLLDIKDMLDEGYTIKEIQYHYLKQEQEKEKISEEKIRIALYQDLMRESGLHPR